MVNKEVDQLKQSIADNQKATCEELKMILSESWLAEIEFMGNKSILKGQKHLRDGRTRLQKLIKAMEE